VSDIPQIDGAVVISIAVDVVDLQSRPPAIGHGKYDAMSLEVRVFDRDVPVSSPALAPGNHPCVTRIPALT
jgi:hypothetical protein